MPDKVSFSRRALVTSAAFAAATAAVGAIMLSSRATAVQPAPNPYTGGLWLSGDHHIHTKYSDGGDTVEEQVGHAASHGLDFCAITDHGGKEHDKIALEKVYPEILAARKKHPGIIVFQGLEWNVPSGDHATVLAPMGPDEAKQVSEFEAMFDRSNQSRPERSKKTPEDAYAGIQYLETISPRPLLFLNHPMRSGAYSPSELRGYSDNGPQVARGFEGAPGHQAGTLARPGEGRRGAYGGKPGASSFAPYPEDGYRTWGGYDWFTATVGGVWDSLLSEGRPWYVTATSDAHGRYRVGGGGSDFFPGEYSKTYVFAAKREPQAIMEAMRAGRIFTVLGDLVDRCELSVASGGKGALVGETLTLARAGQDVEMTLRVRVPKANNHVGERPTVHHVDIITGNLRTKPYEDRDTWKNETAKTVVRLRAGQARKEGDFLVFTHRFGNVRESFYVRVRGTNTDVESPKVDTTTINPWSDLWFYSNPVRVVVP